MPSTTGEILLDTNILIALIFEDHPHHERASSFVRGTNHFYTCPITQSGFLRFATRSFGSSVGIKQPPRLTPASAQEKLVELADTAGHVFLTDDLSFTDLSLRALTGHNQWTDAYLLQLATRHSLHFASMDRRMRNLDDPTVPVFLVIP